MMKNPTDIPQIFIEKLLAGELTEEEAKSIQARLASHAQGMEYLEALADENVQILRSYPPSVVASAVSSRQGKESSSTLWRLGLVAAPLAVGLVLVLLLFPSGADKGKQRPKELVAMVTETPPASKTSSPGNGQELEETTPKGDPTLLVYRRSQEGQEPLESGDLAHEGDIIQLKMMLSGAEHAVVLSVDGRGAVTLHYPLAPGENVSLENGGTISLPRAYELDDAPMFERFIMVTGPATLTVKDALEAARAMDLSLNEPRLALGDDIIESHFLIKKPGRGE
jgi:hypothetical protein